MRFSPRATNGWRSWSIKLGGLLEGIPSVCVEKQHKCPVLFPGKSRGKEHVEPSASRVHTTSRRRSDDYVQPGKVRGHCRDLLSRGPSTFGSRTTGAFPQHKSPHSTAIHRAACGGPHTEICCRGTQGVEWSLDWEGSRMRSVPGGGVQKIRGAGSVHG